jgi:EpsI family protein
MNRRVVLIAITLLVSFGLLRWLSTVSPNPKRDNLSSLPKQAGGWAMVREDVLDDETAKVLKADDYVLRRYAGGPERLVDLFIAYYYTQKAGESMHSPKNCLPGSGWEIVNSDEVALPIDSATRSSTINRYMIQKNADRALVLYWYQANGRVIASEYWAKLYLILDTLRTGRRDGAIVRFIVPIKKGSDGSVELKDGLEMAQNIVPLLPKYLPN